MNTKKLIFIIVLLQFLPVGQVFAQQTQLPFTDINIEGLIGKVKRIEEEKADVVMKNGALAEADRRLTRQVIFDKKGRKTYEWVQIGTLTPREFNYYYDNKNNRHKRTLLNNQFSDPRRPAKDQLSLGVIRFDAKDNAIFEDIYNNERQSPEFLTQRYKYIFDSNGRITEKLMLSVEGDTIVKDTLIFGTEILPTERRLSNPRSPLQQIIKYKYLLDSQGNWVKQTAENTFAKKDAVTKTEVTYRKVTYYK